MSDATGLRVGIDVGGTFTDVVVESASGALLAAFKLSSTPGDPAEAVIAALERVRASQSDAIVEVGHGTTVGTNCLIERRGARTALVATRGFRDVIELRRQARPLLFELKQEISEPLVPRELRFEVDERIAFDGTVVEPLGDATVARLVAALRASGVEAVSICLINGYANPAHEQALRSAIDRAMPGVFVSTGSEIAPEYGEFERTSTAVVNSYIGPRVRSYVERLGAALHAGGTRLFIAKSNGGLAAPATAARFPVHVIESGPAAGVVAAAAYARSVGRSHLIAFDMGGTTSKVGLVRDGQPAMAREFHADRFVEGRDCGGYPVRSHVVDLIEIGAGGGSLAWLDHAGVVRIGPRSAGADPGPACYGRGGRFPTITDAHVVVGNLPTAALAVSGVRLDAGLAVGAIEREIASPLGWSVARAAHAILRVATAQTAELVRLATVRRGIDPRDFALLAYGGAAALHAVELAREVGIPEVLVPPLPGMFSARGTLRADVRHDVARSFLRLARETSPPDLDAALGALEAEAYARLAADFAGDRPHDVVVERSVDVRYEGQLFELGVALGQDAPQPERIEAGFRALYRATYGYELPGSAVQIVNLRVVVRRPGRAPGAAGKSAMAALPHAADHSTLAADGKRVPQPLVARDRLVDGATIDGPLLVSDHGATVVVPARCRVHVSADGWLSIEVGT